MNDSFEVSPPRDDKEIAGAVESMSIAFNIPADRVRSYFDLVGRDSHQLVRVDGAVAGGLAILPMGQFFGGKSVSMAGIAAVNILPQHRARGAGSALMQRTLHQLHEQHFPLSALHPATQPIYRRVGFEQAGSYAQISLPLRSLDLKSRSGELDVRAIEQPHEVAIRALYRRRAALCDGNLDRSEFIWRRIRLPRGEPAAGYMFTRDGEPEGYLYLQQKETSGAQHGLTLQLSDLVALTPAAARTALRFLANHRSMATEALWHGIAADPLLCQLEEQPQKISHLHHWMLRIVDVQAALSARGYSPGFSGELHLDVIDELLPANHGRFMLALENGNASVRGGGRGSLRVHVRGLAMLYSGFLSPLQVRAAGLLDASEADAESAAAAFAGPAPWLADMF